MRTSPLAETPMPLTSALSSTSTTPSATPPAPPILTVAALSKSFGSLRVLDQVSFQVARGETVCLLGPSGSGKSTLLRCINWLERPDSGRILLDGQPVGQSSGGVVMGDRELARTRTRIGMVFQHFALWPHLTVLDNVMAAPLHVQRRPRGPVACVPRGPRKASAQPRAETRPGRPPVEVGPSTCTPGHAPFPPWISARRLTMTSPRPVPW